MPRLVRFLLIPTVLLVACGDPATVDPSPVVEVAAEEPPPGPPIEERPLMVTSARAREALAVGDWATAREHLEATLEHAPGLPQTRFRLAEVTLRQGDPGPALEQLQALVAMGAQVDLAASEVFAPFLDLPEMAVLARALDPAAPRPSEATLLATLPADQWTEGIAIDPANGTVYAGSLERHHILRITTDGTVTDFARDDSAELTSLVGMAIDPGRRQLWIAAGAGSDRPGAATPRTNGLVRYDLDSGERLNVHFPVGAGDRQRLFNDVTVAPDGIAYVTESFESAIWRLEPGGSLRRWRVVPDLAYLNGLAVSNDGRTLWVAAIEGLVWVDLPTGEVGRVAGDAAFFAGLGDGMATLGDDALVIVQNDDFLGQRLARFELSASGRQITGAEVLPFAWPEGRLPYTVAVDDAWIVVVATADLGLRDAAPGVVVPPPVLLRLAR